MTEYLSTEDLLCLIADLEVGPVRDLGLLEAAAHRPATSLWGIDAYPSLERKAAALLDSLLNNHPLVDGNKRLVWLAALVFLDLNGAWIEAPDDEAYDLVIAVASSAAGLGDVENFFMKWRVDSAPVAERL